MSGPKEKTKIYLASDILKDLFFRPRAAKASKAVAKICEAGGVEGVIGSTTVLAIVSSADRPISGETVSKLYDSLGTIFTFTDVTSSDLRKAQKYTIDDYPLAVAAAMADKAGAKYLITSRARTVKGCRAKILSPQEFIDVYSTHLQEEAK